LERQLKTTKVWTPTMFDKIVNKSISHQIN